MLHNTAKFTTIEQKLFSLTPSTELPTLNKSIHRCITDHRAGWLLHEQVFLKALKHRHSLEIFHCFFKNWTSLILSNDSLISGIMDLVNTFPNTSNQNHAQLLDCQQSLLQLMQTKANTTEGSCSKPSPLMLMINQICHGEKWHSSNLLLDESDQWLDFLSEQLDSSTDTLTTLINVVLIELIHCAELDLASSILENSLPNFSLHSSALAHCQPWLEVHQNRDCYETVQLAFNALEKFTHIAPNALSEADISHQFSRIMNKRHNVFCRLAEVLNIPQVTQQTLRLQAC